MVANQNGISSSQGQKICFQIAGFEFMNEIHDIADPDDEDLKFFNNSIIMLTKHFRRVTGWRKIREVFERSNKNAEDVDDIARDGNIRRI